MGTIIYIPKLGANISNVEIGSINFKENDVVKRGDILFEIITDKAIFDVEADSDGTILKLDLKEGDELQILDEIGFIGNEGEEIPEFKIISPSDALNKIKATPLAKKIAKDKNLDINNIFKGTTKIIKEKDILEFIKNNQIIDNLEIEKVSFRKKAEIKNLSESRESILSSVTISIPTKKLKDKIKDYSEKHNLRLTLGEYISHTAAKTLKKFPKLNAYYNYEQINLYKDINIGLAISIEEDLLVPVIHNADKLELTEFSSKVKNLILEIVKNEIKMEDLINSTFTITDLSQYDVFHFNPVLNSKQSAILGICSEYDSCSFIDEKLIYDPKINIILVFDHRVTNGKYASEFLKEFKEQLFL